MPNEGLRVSELLQATITSFDEDTAAFPLPRVMPTAICVDAGDLSGEVGEDIAREVRAALGKFGYREIYEWGPFQGSHLTTIFGISSELEDGRSFREKAEELARDVLGRLKGLPWKRWTERAVAGIKIAVQIGGLVLIFVPQAGVWVQVVLHISPKVWLLLKAVSQGAVAVEMAKKLFFENEHVKEAVKFGPAEPDVSTHRDIQVGRPFRFDPAKIGRNP